MTTPETTPEQELRAAGDKLLLIGAYAAQGLWQIDGPYWWDEPGGGTSNVSMLTVGDDRAPIAIAPPLANRHPKAETSFPWICLMHPAARDWQARLFFEAADRWAREVIRDTAECPQCDAGTYPCGGHPDMWIHDGGCGGVIAGGSPMEDCHCFDTILTGARDINRSGPPVALGTRQPGGDAQAVNGDHSPVETR